MGFDGLISFLIRNLPNDAFDDVDLNINHNKILSKYVLIDISFILYNCYLEVENDINTILKYICGISCTNYSKILNLVESKLINSNWKNIKVILDGNNQNEICKNFIDSITANDNKILDDIMLIKVTERLESVLTNIFTLDFIDDVVLFFDSIPSYSKILEQRKRRLKNYLESQNRKEYYKKYFTNLKNKIIYDEKEDFEYDYFSWITSKFNCNKIIDSNSNFVKKLKVYIMKNLNLNTTNKINIKVDDEEYGEADFKIFRYISNNKLEDLVTILSCDSDLVYQIITQQLNYHTLNSNVKLNLCKFYINSFEHCQHYNANKIINNLNNLYKDCNNTLNIGEFCLDLMVILNFFGNDLLPSSFEIGPELNLSTLMKVHYNSLGKAGNSLIYNSLENNGETKSLNLNNLKVFLKEINKNSIFTKIILLRFYKVPYNIVTILTDKLNFNLPDVKKFIEEYLIYKGYIEIEKNKNKLEENDIRFIKYNEFKIKILKDTNEIEDISKHVKEPLKINNYNNSLNNTMVQLENLLDNYLDYTDLKNLGLLNSSDNLELENNMYQNLYNYISSKSNLDRSTCSQLKMLNNETQIKNKENIKLRERGNSIISDDDNCSLVKDEMIVNKSYNNNLIDFNLSIEDSNEEHVENYLLILHYIVRNFFNDMCNYNSTNLIVYKYDNVPSLINIIDFIQLCDTEKMTKKFDKNIETNIIPTDKYFNPILHHLIITPYLLESNYINLMSNKEILNSIIKNFDSVLSNIWSFDCYNFETFTLGELVKTNQFIKDKLKYINPKLILTSWNNLLIKLNKTQKLEINELGF